MRCASTIGLVVVVSLTAFLLLPAIAAPASWAQICAGEPGVVPGVGFGSIMLGMPFTDTVAALGTPTYMGVNPDAHASIEGNSGWHDIKNAVDGSRGLAIAQYGSRQTGQLQIQARDNSVTFIQAYLVPTCHDDAGISMGGSWPTVVQKYGQQYSIRIVPDGVAVIFDSIGLKVAVAPTLSDTGVVTWIGVFAKNQACVALGKQCALYKPPLQ